MHLTQVSRLRLVDRQAFRPPHVLAAHRRRARIDVMVRRGDRASITTLATAGGASSGVSVSIRYSPAAYFVSSA